MSSYARYCPRDTDMLTKYEATEIIAARALLLSKGAPSMLTTEQDCGSTNCMCIASHELLHGHLDVQVIRDGVAKAVQSMRLPECVASMAEMRLNAAATS